MFEFARFEAYDGLFSGLELVGVGFLVLAAVETVWDFVAKRRKGIGETAANTLIVVGNDLLERTSYGLIFIIALFLAEPLALIEIPHTWWSWLLAILAADLCYYWMHRWEHEVRILWAYHSVHHSSPEFNLTTAFRLAWVEGLVEWAFFVPMILVGFDVVQTIAAIGIVVAYQSWIHTEKVGKLGWLDKIFNTPSNHRVHHAKNRKYLDRNYGGILILWDRLFGTYQVEEEKVAYGVHPAVGSVNPLIINFHEFWRIARDVVAAKSWSDAFRYVFGRPGWTPVARKSGQPDGSV